jgi:hypothetical protein
MKSFKTVGGREAAVEPTEVSRDRLSSGRAARAYGRERVDRMPTLDHRVQEGLRSDDGKPPGERAVMEGRLGSPRGAEVFHGWNACRDASASRHATYLWGR